MVCSQEDLIYELRWLKVVCNGLMPKSMVLLAVVFILVGSHLCGILCLTEMFCWRCLGSCTLVCQGSFVRCDSSWRAESSCWREILSEVFEMVCIIWSQWEKLCVSRNLATLPSSLHVLINLHCTQQLQILVTALHVQCTLCTLWLR